MAPVPPLAPMAPTPSAAAATSAAPLLADTTPDSTSTMWRPSLMRPSMMRSTMMGPTMMRPSMFGFTVRTHEPVPAEKRMPEEREKEDPSNHFVLMTKEGSYRVVPRARRPDMPRIVLKKPRRQSLIDPSKPVIACDASGPASSSSDVEDITDPIPFVDLTHCDRPTDRMSRCRECPEKTGEDEDEDEDEKEDKHTVNMAPVMKAYIKWNQTKEMKVVKTIEWKVARKINQEGKTEVMQKVMQMNRNHEKSMTAGSARKGKEVKMVVVETIDLTASDDDEDDGAEAPKNGAGGGRPDAMELPAGAASPDQEVEWVK